MRQWAALDSKSRGSSAEEDEPLADGVYSRVRTAPESDFSVRAAIVVLDIYHRFCDPKIHQDRYCADTLPVIGAPDTLTRWHPLLHVWR